MVYGFKVEFYRGGRDMNKSFYSSIVSLYDHIFPVMVPAVSFCNEFIHESASILEVGCATGNLVDALRNGQRKITGIDYDDEMVRFSRKRFSGFKDVQISALDMKCLQKNFRNGVFDSVICFGNTLVHLKDVDEMMSVLSRMNSISACKGTLLLQIINYDRIFENNDFELPEIDNEHINFLRKYEKRDDKRVDFNTVLTDKKNGKVIKNSVPLYPVSSSEIVDAVKQSGWKDVLMFGTFKKEEFKPSESYHLIIKAGKQS